MSWEEEEEEGADSEKKFVLRAQHSFCLFLS